MSHFTVLLTALALFVHSKCLSFALSQQQYLLLSSYTIIFDAGSTSTRMFIFKQTGTYSFEHLDSKIIEITPSLSEIYNNSNMQKHQYMKDAFQTAISAIPEEEHNRTKVLILGTGGMRLLDDKVQQEVYSWLFHDIQNDPEIPFHLERSNIRTISGDEEGFYAAITVNYLSSSIKADLLPQKIEIFGALDLGGASTQVVFDIAQRWRFRFRSKRAPPLSTSDFFTNSYLGYGANQMMEKLTAYIIANASNSNPCWFIGYSLNGLEGSGNAKQCIKTLSNIIEDHNKECPRDQKCALDSKIQPDLTGSFYAFSTFHYAMDFASTEISRDMEMKKNLTPFTLPNPSMHEISQAADFVCGMPMSRFGQDWKQNPLTPSNKIFRRCFDICYSLTLLQRYGFKKYDRRVFFANEIRNQTIHWSFGAYLSYRLEIRSVIDKDQKLRAILKYSSGLSYGAYFSLAVFIIAFGYLYSQYMVAKLQRCHTLQFVSKGLYKDSRRTC